MRVAHSFCAGDMLTVVINQDGKFIFNWGYPDLEDLPNQENIEELIKNLNYWRKGIGKKYLHTGEMVKPYTVECEKNTIFGSDGYDREFEKIFTSAWKDNNGSFGQFFVNYTDKDVHCVVDLPEGKYRLYQNDTDFVEINGGKTEITIKKLSAILIEK